MDDPLTNTFESIAAAIGRNAQVPIDGIDDVVDVIRESIPGKSSKPLMSQINTMRAQLCWTRPDLWHHEDCMAFLGLVCAESSTGLGICSSFTNGVAARCVSEENKTAREAFCQMAKKLGVKVKKAGHADGNKGKSDGSNNAASGESAQENGKQTAGGGSSGANAGGANARQQEEEKDAGTGVTIENGQGGGSVKEKGTGGGGHTGADTKSKTKEAENPDRDGDGVKNADDLFPDDPKEWRDLDHDGIGDNSDIDRDGDHVNNVEDGFPDDPTRFIKDGDGDGVLDKDDVFPNDPKEWGDMDKDGIGNNGDQDRDGDGHFNVKDSHPDDPKRFIDHDTDGDGIFDYKDVFPTDPHEWKDSDKDGVGDNTDAAPFDANCVSKPCPKRTTHSKGSIVTGTGSAKDGQDQSSDVLNVPHRPVGKAANKPLPDQGYDEHSVGNAVHENMYTWTSDWREEWPNTGETEAQTITRICKANPKNTWCKGWFRHQKLKRSRR